MIKAIKNTSLKTLKLIDRIVRKRRIKAVNAKILLRFRALRKSMGHSLNHPNFQDAVLLYCIELLTAVLAMLRNSKISAVQAFAALGAAKVKISDTEAEHHKNENGGKEHDIKPRK